MLISLLAASLAIALGLSVFFSYRHFKTQKVAVPGLIKLPLSEAKRLTDSGGLKLIVTYTPANEPRGTVTFQMPKEGTLLRKGGFVELAVSSGQATQKNGTYGTISLNRNKVTKKKIEPVRSEPPVITSGFEPATSSVSKFTGKPKARICIDPGHQQRGDNSTEPIGPGAKVTKPKVTGGAVGVSTKKPEYALMLDISIQLKKYLEDRGFEVLLTRDKNDVNISNSQRAKIANDWNADLFIRLHADSNNSSSVKGISTLYPAKNSWTGNIYQKSFEWAQTMHNALITATGRTNRNVVSRTELSGFNWSKVPTILIEMGFLSNPEEDRLLNTSDEQQKIIEAIGKTLVNKFN